MSILTICFHAVNRSIRMSEGLSSCGAVFFLIWDGVSGLHSSSIIRRSAGRAYQGLIPGDGGPGLGLGPGEGVEAGHGGCAVGDVEDDPL